VQSSTPWREVCKTPDNVKRTSVAAAGIESGDLINTYMRSKFEDTRLKALKFGAHGTTVKAYKPPR
jgi:hypothetical protein